MKILIILNVILIAVVIYQSINRSKSIKYNDVLLNNYKADVMKFNEKLEKDSIKQYDDYMRKGEYRVYNEVQRLIKYKI